MKHIKTFEKCTEEERLLYDDCNDYWYWRVSNKYPDILIAFDKLGIPEGEFEWLWSEDNHLLKDVYLFKTKYENSGKINWSYADLGWKNPDYRKPPMYMGKVEISDEDRNIRKYNL